MEKLLVESNFSFSQNVFHCYISLVRQNAGEKTAKHPFFHKVFKGYDNHFKKDCLAKGESH